MQVLGADADPFAHVAPAGPPVVKTLSGKAVIPDHSECAVGSIGLLGTRPGEDLIESSDTLLTAGANFLYAQHLPSPGAVRVVQLEADPARAGVRLPTELLMIGNAKESLAALLPMVTRTPPTEHLAASQTAMTCRRSDMTALQDPDRSPIAPHCVVGVLDEVATDDAILAYDSGTIATLAARPRPPGGGQGRHAVDRRVAARHVRAGFGAGGPRTRLGGQPSIGRERMAAAPRDQGTGATGSATRRSRSPQ